jgi:2-polyprenyl-6-methoxyphenol hydroxylase-like FAD-dependent oxidoreductase
MTYDILVIGAGPAGLTTAITAARNGARVLLVERHPGTSIHPRATAIRTRTMEIFRSWGIDRRIRARAIPVRPELSISRTLREAPPVGVSMGYPTDPRDVLARSPTPPVCAPQDQIEPVLAEHLRACGGELRFGVELTELVDHGDHVEALLSAGRDGHTIRVHARFVVGADGPRGDVRRALGIGHTRLGVLGEFVNVVFRADLDPIVAERRSVLHWIEHPDAEGMMLPTGPARWGYIRQWHPEHGEAAADLTPERCATLIRTAVGEPDLDLQIAARLPFTMAADLADTFRVGNGFLVGDAAHRMTPVGGHGLNTAVHAAHNLGWKLAWVARGRAGDALLDSYQAERRPIAEHNARISLRITPSAADALAADLDVGYDAPVPGPAGADPTTARPGARAPHAWVTLNGHRHGLLDLFDGHLTLLTGRHGDRWRTCTARLAADLPLRVLTLGHEIRDDGGAFRRHYTLGNDAALLIRPDGYVAWRSDAADDPPRQLTAAVDLALGRPPTHTRLAA